MIERLADSTLGAGLKLEQIATAHLRALPHTASSRAGDRAVRSLYRALIADGNSVVLWGQGGFAAGTKNLRATEASVKSGVSFGTKLKLGAQHLLHPAHLLGRMIWENRIPQSGIGYILTIGASPSVRGKELLARLEEEMGQREIWVDTEASNAQAISFYERNGYREEARSFGQVLLRKART